MVVAASFARRPTHFPALDSQWQISTDGGSAPLWSADGPALYSRRGNAVMKVAVGASNGTFRHGNPEVLFEGDYVREESSASAFFAPSYALDRSTDRFLMMKQEPVAPREIVVIVNWASTLQSQGR